MYFYTHTLESVNEQGSNWDNLCGIGCCVAQVTLNRLKSGRWGNDICSVVYSKAQFSWTLKKKLEKPSGTAWADSQWIAHRVLHGDRVHPLKDAMYYHADYVSPKWQDPVAKIQQVGQHIFYTKAKVKITKI